MPVKPSTKYIGALTLGIVIGASVANGLPYLGVNFRLLPYTENGYTIVQPDRGIHGGRLERIFAQFAHQLHPHCTSKEVHKALNATWLKRDMIHGIYVLGGKIPLHNDDSQPFSVAIPSDDNKLLTRIWLGIAGGEGTEEEAYAFLTGTGADGLRLTQFALEYPATQYSPRRFELFSWWGIQGSSW